MNVIVLVGAIAFDVRGSPQTASVEVLESEAMMTNVMVAKVSTYLWRTFTRARMHWWSVELLGASSCIENCRAFCACIVLTSVLKSGAIELSGLVNA